MRSLWIVGMLTVLCPLNMRGEIPASAFQLMPPMGQIYHPVSTSNPEAQKNFNRGLTYIFAFNHDIAFAEFEKASKLDPQLAMAYWGMALALGQNMNSDVTPENELKAYNYIQQALKLESTATPEEKAYIHALATRYTNDPKANLIPLRFHYRAAMKKVVEEYPQDLDAATLYAEAILNLNPWKWWTPQGMPKDGTYEAIDVLESVLARNPLHIGANHYYIHAWEESPYPERALMSAHRLTYLLPESGHLLHMPCHIFLLVGDYKQAVETNLKAIEQDRAYIQKAGMSGPYPLHYLKHNLYILARAYMLLEDDDNAIKAANALTQFVQPHLQMMPELAFASKAPLDIYLYFHKWQEILDYQLIAQTTSMQAYLHFARAVAFAGLGKVDEAQKEREQLQQLQKQIKPSEEYANNPFVKILEVADVMAEAALAKAQKASDKYIAALKKGMALQEMLDYDEPPPWCVQIRQQLGFALLEKKDFKGAEQEFKVCLQKMRRNGRSLFGLTQGLKGQERSVDAYWVEREMRNAVAEWGEGVKGLERLLSLSEF